jgi:hypothetical protein
MLVSKRRHSPIAGVLLALLKHKKLKPSRKRAHLVTIGARKWWCQVVFLVPRRKHITTVLMTPTVTLMGVQRHHKVVEQR